MFSWFRRARPDRHSALAMVDPRPGNIVLLMGAGDPRLAGETGASTGLNGRTVVVDAADRRTRVEQAAAEAGALVEFVDAPLTSLPLDPGTFDLVVAPDITGWPADAMRPRLAEAIRVLRPAGRLVLIAGQRRTGVSALLPAPAPTLTTDAVIALLTTAGFVAARRLAVLEGVSYYEGRKPRD